MFSVLKQVMLPSPHYRGCKIHRYDIYAFLVGFITHSSNIYGMGSSFRRNEVLRSFRWTDVTYDWLIVALNTIGQSQLTNLHPNDLRNHCTRILYPFSRVSEVENTAISTKTLWDSVVKTTRSYRKAMFVV